MAYPRVTEEAVYLCTGNPLPSDVEQILTWLLNAPLGQAYAGKLQPDPWHVLLEARGSHASVVLRSLTCCGTALCVRVCVYVLPWRRALAADVLAMQVSKGVALSDIVREVHARVIPGRMDLPTDARVGCMAHNMPSADLAMRP